MKEIMKSDENMSFREMLTLLQTGQAFRRILLFFKPPPADILDLTYGNGKSWESLEQHEKKHYNITKMDLYSTSADIKADVRLPLPFKSRNFDVVYFDPPFYFREEIYPTIPVITGKILSDEKELFWTKNDLSKSVINLGSEVPRVLRTNGIFIVKISDSYVGKKYIPTHIKVGAFLSKKMSMIATIIAFSQTKKTSMPGFVRLNNFYYLIFEKVALNEN